jgi:hypothetical protein
VVRGDVPFARMAVLSLPANRDGDDLFGCLHYWGPVCPVERDGSFRLCEPPGQRVLLVVDLWSGVVLSRTGLAAVAPDSRRQQDLEVKALPLDVDYRNLPADCEPWLDLVVAAANWPAGLGQMVELGEHRKECGLGVSLIGAANPFRLWLPAGATRLVLRRNHAIYHDGRDILADREIDAANQQGIVLDAKER